MAVEPAMAHAASAPLPPGSWRRALLKSHVCSLHGQPPAKVQRRSDRVPLNAAIKASLDEVPYYEGEAQYRPMWECGYAMEHGTVMSANASSRVRRQPMIKRRTLPRQLAHGSCCSVLGQAVGVWADRVATIHGQPREGPFLRWWDEISAERALVMVSDDGVRACLLSNTRHTSLMHEYTRHATEVCDACSLSAGFHPHGGPGEPLHGNRRVHRVGPQQRTGWQCRGWWREGW